MSNQSPPQALPKPLDSNASNTWWRILAFAREVLLTARSQGVTSALVAIIAAASVGLVLGTAGLSAAAQSEVLSSIDEVGTRSVTIYSKNQEEGLPTETIDFLEKLDIVESAVGFSETVDVSNAAITGGKSVALRLAYGQFVKDLTTSAGGFASQPQTANANEPLIAFATKDALDTLGLPATGGGVRVTNEGLDVNVIGVVELPENLKKLSPTVILPVDTAGSLSAIYLSTHTPEQVSLLTEIIRAELRDYTSQDYSVETSQAYADLRSAIDGQLTASSHTLIISVLSGGAGATMLVVWAVVLLRRKDLGRRRALGASRMMILALTMAQSTLLTLIGALAGGALGYTALSLLSHPTPPIGFTAAVTIALVSASTLLAILPALWAANRDPLTELRVP